MAVLLYRLGRFAFRNRWATLGVWILVLVAAGGAAATLSAPTSDSFSIPGVPALQTLELQAERFAAPGETASDEPVTLPASAQIVFAAPDGETLATPERQAAIMGLIQALTGSEQVAQIIPPIPPGQTMPNGQAIPSTVSPDGRIAFATVQYTDEAIKITDTTRENLSNAVEAARATGLQVEVGGEVMQTPPEAAATEALGVGVAAVVLWITLGSLVAAGLPLFTGILGVGIGVSLVTAASGFIELSSTAPVLAMMLGLAVAIDYALFILTRYRHEIASGHEREVAAGRAVGTAGSAVVFAGLTVIIALAGLSIVNIPFLTAMGLAAALTVAIAVLIAISLLPALIAIVGRFAAGKPSTAPIPILEPRTAGENWGRFVTRNKVAVLIVAVLGLGVMAIPTLDLQLALPGPATMAPETTERKAYDLVAEGFGPGFNGPLLVLADLQPTAAAERQATIGAVMGSLSGTPGIVQVMPLGVNPAGDTALFQVTPEWGPNDSRTEDLVQTIRDLPVAGVELGVTGLPAIQRDVSVKLGDALLPYMLVVAGLAVILLLLVFRSVVVPIKATLGFLLTIGATFGAVVAVFQWGWFAGLIGLESTGPIMSMLPIFMIGIVFGLAMDYQVFLVTRMREEFVHGASPTEAVVRGVKHGARVVTAAALIMMAVFTGFLLGGEQIIMSIGFAMAVGVAIDAFVVRLTIVPAFMAIVGRAGWWLPRWLGAILPNVDVEGEKLMQHLGRERSVPAQPAVNPAE